MSIRYAVATLWILVLAACAVAPEKKCPDDADSGIGGTGISCAEAAKDEAQEG